MIATVSWWDSSTIDEWMPRDEAIKELCSPVETIGYLLEENVERLILCHSKAEDGTVCGVIVIPRGCVFDIVKL